MKVAVKGSLPSFSDAHEVESLEAIAVRYSMHAMNAGELAQVQADFSIASFAECQRRGCVIGRWRLPDDDDAALLFICHDPLDLDRQQWFEPLIERLAPEHL